MLFAYSIIKVEGIVKSVLVDSEDADLVVLCAYFASILPGELYIRRKRVNVG